LGQRTHESAVRAHGMRERGDSDTQVRDQDGERILCPIASWSTDDVWEFLALSGTGKPYPSYVNSFAETLRIYSSASGECAAITGGDDNAAPCGGARYGCSLCCATGSRDKTMDALLADPEMGYLQGLSRLRTFLVNTQYDFSRRRWVGRDIDPATGHVCIAPNNYSAAMCELLLRCALTLDKREQDRAERARLDLLSGRIPNTERNRRMSRPQFELIGARELVAIDLFWAQDNLHRPHQAIRAWDDVHVRGILTDIPAVAPAERQPMPVPRWLWVGSYDTGDGFFNPIAQGLCETCGQDVVDPRMGGAFDVDIETAWFILDEERERLLARNADQGYTVAAVFWFYVNLGVVEFRRGQEAIVSLMLRRGEFWREHGLAGDIDPRSLTTISDAEHRVLKAVGPSLAPQSEPDDGETPSQMALVLHFPPSC